MLPKLFDERISDSAFDDKRRRHLAEDGVRIRDKEQLFYYEVYRSIIGVPHPQYLIISRGVCMKSRNSPSMLYDRLMYDRFL